MTQMLCPFCGAREPCEFVFHKTAPPAGPADAFSQVYLRTERSDRSEEYWQHSRGCRAWLHVIRDPGSGQILQIKLLGDSAT